MNGELYGFIESFCKGNTEYEPSMSRLTPDFLNGSIHFLHLPRQPLNFQFLKGSAGCNRLQEE
jgi:hypothetical protein